MAVGEKSFEECDNRRGGYLRCLAIVGEEIVGIW